MNDDLKLGTKQYPTSSTSKDFRDDQVNPNMQFLRIFFDWGSEEEMHQEEHELLTKYRTPENKHLFYNLDNQRAGTKKVDEKIYAVGGRVLNFVCVSEDFSKSRDQIFGLINSLNWDNGFFRKDIGYKVIN